MWTPLPDTDGDGECDIYDICPTIPGGTGDPCDDGDPCTLNEVITSNCGCLDLFPIDCNDNDPCTSDLCVGGFCVWTPLPDTDGDGICDHWDLCAMIPGEPGDDCDDGNPCTGSDLIDPYCICRGMQKDCNDGDACTEDCCDTATGDCTHILLTGCENDLHLAITTDAFGDQTSWQVRPLGSATVLCSNTGPLPDNSSFVATCSLADGTFLLEFLDSFGDGMCCAFGNGGYVLRMSDGRRIIDNAADGDFGSTSSVALGFTLPIGTDQLTVGTCDREDLLPTSVIVAAENGSVSAQYGVTNATSGYQFWLFDPDGGYSRRIFQHMTAGAGAAGPTRSCHLKLSSIVTNPVPSMVLLNTRVRGRVAGSYLPFGPACRTKVDPSAAACPTTHLVNNVLDPHHSCGIADAPLDGTRKIWADVVTGANKYQFEFTAPGYLRHIAGTTPSLQLKVWAVHPLSECTDYDVRVHASFDAGATWCPFGAACVVGIGGDCGGGDMAQGGVRNGSGPDVMVWPNPNRDHELHVSVGGLDPAIAAVEVTLSDAIGSTVLHRAIAAHDGVANGLIQLDPRPVPGLYIMTIGVGDLRRHARLVLE